MKLTSPPGERSRAARIAAWSVIALGSVATALALISIARPAAAHDAKEETVTPVQRQALPEMPGKQIVMAVVAYEPGQASAGHVHDGSVFAYVLEGEIASQLEGQPTVVYKAGQSWYEPPKTPHLVSRNASASRPAKLLAILVVDEGGALKRPLPAR